MDLTPFAGHMIDLYFTTWQDGAFTLQMRYVDDISIPEIGIFDDMEAEHGIQRVHILTQTWNFNPELNYYQITLN